MEHRWNPRNPTDIRVTLYHNRMPVIITKISNISTGGLFVDSRIMAYSRNTLLDVEFQLPTDKGSKQFTMRTYVVYGSDSGMGLIFLDSDPHLSQAIKHMTRNSSRGNASLPKTIRKPVSANENANSINYKSCTA